MVSSVPASSRPRRRARPSSRRACRPRRPAGRRRAGQNLQMAGVERRDLDVGQAGRGVRARMSVSTSSSGRRSARGSGERGVLVAELLVHGLPIPCRPCHAKPEGEQRLEQDQHHGGGAERVPQLQPAAGAARRLPAARGAIGALVVGEPRRIRLARVQVDHEGGVGALADGAVRARGADPVEARLIGLLERHRAPRARVGGGAPVGSASATGRPASPPPAGDRRRRARSRASVPTARAVVASPEGAPARNRAASCISGKNPGGSEVGPLAVDRGGQQQHPAPARARPRPAPGRRSRSAAPCAARARPAAGRAA